MKNVALVLAGIGMAVWAASAQVVIPPVNTVSISGTVHDDPFPSKRVSLPVAGAKVGLWRQLAILNNSGAMLPGIGSVRVDSAITNATGKFSFAAATSGLYQIIVDDPSYNSRTISVDAARDTSMTIVLVAAGAHAPVAGTVWAACSGVLGMPCILSAVAGCTVTVVKALPGVSPAAKAAIVAPVLEQLFTAVTNSQGQYSLDSIPVTVNGERITVTATKSGFQSASADTSIRNTITTTVNFTLTMTAGAPHDTVYVSPPKPTSQDSLTFSLVNTEHCCATVYRNKTVTVNDTTIFLSYSFDDSLCASVRCLTAGSQTDFSSKPVPAGRYAIYKLESYYCPPPRLCPAIAYAPVLVGRVTVTPASATAPVVRDRVGGREYRIVSSGSFALVTVEKNAVVSIAAYDVRGALLGELYRGRMTQGTHRVALAAREGERVAATAVILRLYVDGKEAASDIAVVRR